MFGYRDNTGLEHESYTAACIYYGADTPESLAAEMADRDREEREELMDRMAAGEIMPGACFFDQDDIPF